MSIRYLDLSGAVNFWTNIKNYILSKIPTKTSELTNDSGFLTQHQSLSNYVTLNSEQTITGKKLFTNSTTQVNSVNTFTGSTQFIDLSTTVPRGEFPESAYRVGRVYIGDNTSYNGSWFIIDPTIDTDKAYYRMVTTNPDNTDSTRFIIEWNSNYEGARRRRNISLGDLMPYTTGEYNLGGTSNAWKDVYATNYYYGADAVEFSTKFVTSDTAQTITGAKTFSSTITGSISGNASTATEFSANKDVTLTGDVTGTASSKAGWSVSTTLSNSGVTAGTYGPSEDVTGNNNATISVPEITVDSKGRVTSVTNRTLTCKNNTYNVYNKTLTIQKNGTNVATFTSNSNTNVTANITVPTKTSELTNDSNFLTTSSSLNASKLTGTIDIARLPQGALERVITVANQTARFALTTSSVQLGDTVKQLDTGVMYVVVNESKLNSNDGYLEYTAGSASSVPWSGITSKPTEFTPSSHTHTKSEITDFPTNVSAFTNDSGYLTSHQSLANYVTTNTSQSISGIKNFTDDTFIKSLNFTNEVPSPSSSSVSIMPIITTITYGDNSPSVQARLNFRVTADGVKSLYPHENNQYLLGLTSRRWSSIFGYFVNLGGVYLGNEASINQRTNLYLLATRDTDGQSGAYITRFRQNRAQGALQPADLQKIGFDVLENEVRTNNVFDIQCTDWLNDVPQRVNFVSSVPSYSYGKSSNKALINDLNPSALSMPDLSNGIDISSYITHLDKVVNSYTPSVNGYIFIRVKKTSLPIVSIRIQQNYGLMTSCETSDFSTWGTYLPVVAEKIVEIYVSADSLASAIFFPCQGNV